MKISEMVVKLQRKQKEHGDLDIYTFSDWLTTIKYESDDLPRVAKVYHQKQGNYGLVHSKLSNDDIDIADKDLHNVDLTKPIVKAIII